MGNTNGRNVGLMLAIVAASLADICPGLRVKVSPAGTKSTRLGMSAGLARPGTCAKYARAWSLARDRWIALERAAMSGCLL